MKPKPFIALIGCTFAVISAALIQQFGTAFAQQLERIDYPTDYRRNMAHYATVDRPDGKIYEIFINHEARAAYGNTNILPNGTTLVIESFVAQRNANGQLTRDARGRLQKATSENEIHVTQKRNNWLPSRNEQTSGQWRVAAFDPRNATRIESIKAADCHSCHTDQSKPSRDFVFS